jgi:hypothetical protein
MAVVIKGADAYQDTVDFIKEKMKLTGERDGEKRFQVNQDDYHTYLKNEGITKETVKQVSEAVTKFNNAAAVVMTEVIAEDPNVIRASINTRTSNGVMQGRMTREKETRTPGSGEIATKYGVYGVKLNIRSRMDKGLLEECSAAIEKAMK